MEPRSIPSNVLFKYEWRVPFDVNLEEVEDCDNSSFVVGDEVWVKPPMTSCTKQWTLGVVTSVESTHTVCIDGMPRHVRDIRKRRYGRRRGVVPENHGHYTNGVDHEDSAWVGGGGGGFATPGGEPEEVTATEPVEEALPEELAIAPPVGGDGNGEVAEQPEQIVAEPAVPLRRSLRERRPPVWMKDYNGS